MPAPNEIALEHRAPSSVAAYRCGSSSSAISTITHRLSFLSVVRHGGR